MTVKDVVSRGPVVGGTLLTMGASALHAGQGVAIALLIAAAFTGAEASGMLSLVLTVVAVILLRTALTVAADSFFARSVSALASSWRERIFHTLIAGGPLSAAHERSGSLQTTLGDGLESAAGYQLRYRPLLYNSFIAPLGMVVLLAVVAWPAALAALVGAALMLIVPALWHKSREKSSAQVFTDLATLDADYTDTIQGLLTVKAFNASSRWRRRIAEQTTAVERSVMRELHITLGLVGATQLAMLGGTLAAITIAGWMTVQGNLSIAAALIVLFVMREIYRPIQAVGALAHEAMGGAEATAAVKELLATAETVTDSAESRALATRSAVDSVSVVFDDVAFRYPGRDDDALQGVTFRVLPGETVVIVGPSGAGKSTIASLMMRFAEPGQGQILVEGTSLGERPIGEARALTALVAQDTYLFHGSVRENIALARPDASDADITEAARRSGVLTMIDAMPHGLDTMVGERGTQLSGGQRQRIAIARALLKDAPILILDEATSSVDTASEAQIQQALDETARDRTTLVIAHRLSTVENADRILVLDAGRIVQSGTHAELRAQDGLYQSLLRSQEQQANAPLPATHETEDRR